MNEGRFSLSALAVRERSITLFLICLITLAGVISFFKLGRAEDPAFTIKVMTVITAWPGATAQEMHDQVAEKIEKRMQELRWYDRAETTFGGRFPWSRTPESARNACPRFHVEPMIEPLTTNESLAGSRSSKWAIA